MASRYTWASVRPGIQVSARFRWGVDSQHLSTVLLKEKSATPGQTALPKQRTAAGRRLGPGGKEVCLQFNAGKCSYGGTCHFEHVNVQVTDLYHVIPCRHFKLGTGCKMEEGQTFDSWSEFTKCQQAISKAASIQFCTVASRTVNHRCQ